MSEPKDKNSHEWRDWFVRHNFGPTTAIAIKATQTREPLDILKKFIEDIQKK
jgi:hypothetical protein